MRSTRIHCHILAPRALVYRALLDAEALPAWRVPQGMRCHVHRFEPHEGGQFRVSLSYEKPTGSGKTDPQTDTYHGQFVKLVPDTLMVEAVEFETIDPAMRGEMTITTSLTDAEDGTHLLAVHDALPPGVALADNEAGWRMSLNKLKALLDRPNRVRVSATRMMKAHDETLRKLAR